MIDRYLLCLTFFDCRRIFFLIVLNSKKYLNADDDNVYLSSKEELQQYLDFRKENDEWIEVYINSLSAVGIPQYPLFIPDKCSDIKVKRVGHTIDVEDIRYEAAENKDCIDKIGLFLVIPYQNKMVPFPVRELAFSSICQRADDFCGSMARFDPKSNKMVLPIDEKAERLTRDFPLYSDKCKILYRDGKISAALSKEYQILPCDELIEALEEKIKKDHPNISFISGRVSHEFLIASYKLNDIEMEESLRLKLNDLGCNIRTLEAGVEFSSSDVGLSCVNTNVYIEVDGIKIILSGISMAHKRGVSVSQYSEKLQDFGMIMKESEDKIEKLGNTDIKDISLVIKRITEKNQNVFRKQQRMKC